MFMCFEMEIWGQARCHVVPQNGGRHSILQFAMKPPQRPGPVRLADGVMGFWAQKWGQARYLARRDAAGQITPDGSGRRLRFHLGSRTVIEVENVPPKSAVVVRPDHVRAAGQRWGA